MKKHINHIMSGTIESNITSMEFIHLKVFNFHFKSSKCISKVSQLYGFGNAHRYMQLKFYLAHHITQSKDIIVFIVILFDKYIIHSLIIEL